MVSFARVVLNLGPELLSEYTMYYLLCLLKSTHLARSSRVHASFVAVSCVILVRASSDFSVTIRGVMILHFIVLVDYEASPNCKKLHPILIKRFGSYTCYSAEFHRI